MKADAASGRGGGQGAEDRQAQQVALDMKASASGQVPIPACVRRGSAAAALAPRLQSSGCADEAALHQPEDPGRQARCWTLADERYERLGAEAKALAARHTASAAASEDARAEAARGGQGSEVREGAAEEGGTLARRKTSAASLCIEDSDEQ